jgi:hypothetical protein
MPRLFAWVAVAAMVGAAAYLFLPSDAEDDATDAGAYAALDAGGPDAGGGPLLHGGGDATRAAAAATQATGEFELKGVVKDEADAAVAGVTVEGRRTGPGWQRSDPATWNQDPGQSLLDRILGTQRGTFPEYGSPVTTTSGADGTFTLRPNAEGSWRLQARPEGPRYGARVDRQVSRNPQWDQGPATLRVFEGVALQGRVEDTSGAPLRARVQATASVKREAESHYFEDVAEAGEDGRFLFPGVPKEMIGFTVALPDGRRFGAYRFRAPAEQGIVLRVPLGGAAVEGRVTNQQGAAVADARLLVGATPATAKSEKAKDPKADSDSPATISVCVTTDAEGRYRAEGLPDGSLSSLEAYAPGYLPARQDSRSDGWDEPTLAAGKPLERDLVLSRGGRLFGHVLRAGSAEPIAEARVRLLPAQGQGADSHREPRVATTGADGRYEFALLGAGRWLLVVDHERYIDPVFYARIPQPNVWDERMMQPPDGRTVVVGTDEEAVQRDVELTDWVRVV